MPLSPAPSDWHDYEFRGKVVYLDDVKGLVASLEKFGDVEIQVDHDNGALTTSVVEDLSDIEGRDLYSMHVTVKELGTPGHFADVRIGGMLSSASANKDAPETADVIRHFVQTVDPYRPPLKYRLLHPRWDYSRHVDLRTEFRKDARGRRDAKVHDVRLLLIGAIAGALLGAIADVIVSAV